MYRKRDAELVESNLLESIRNVISESALLVWLSNFKLTLSKHRTSTVPVSFQVPAMKAAVITAHIFNKPARANHLLRVAMIDGPPGLYEPALIERATVLSTCNRRAHGVCVCAPL